MVEEAFCVVLELVRFNQHRVQGQIVNRSHLAARNLVLSTAPIFNFAVVVGDRVTIAGDSACLWTDYFGCAILYFIINSMDRCPLPISALGG